MALGIMVKNGTDFASAPGSSPGFRPPAPRPYAQAVDNGDKLQPT